MCRILTVAFFALITTSTARGDALFNGKDLSGWSTYLQGERKDHDATHVFSVDDDGTLHLYKNPPEGKPAIGYIATTQPYADYRLRFQYKWERMRADAKPGTRRNSGLLYHIRGDNGDRGTVWPCCIQCQVQERSTGEIVALGASVTTTVEPEKKPPTYKENGTPFTTPKDSKASSRVAGDKNAEVDGWNTVEVEVRDNTAVHIVNGKVVAKFIEATAPAGDGSWSPLVQGSIGFQAEGFEIFYRNIEIESLKPPGATRP